jgi:hypothetical protein
MARTNTKGTSFYHLGLNDKQEKALKKYLYDEDITARQYIRYLIKKDLSEKSLLEVTSASILKLSKK